MNKTDLVERICVDANTNKAQASSAVESMIRANSSAVARISITRRGRMRKSLLFATAVVLLSSGLWAQSPYNLVSEVHLNKPKPGMQAQYEEARKKHMAWHQAQKDTSTWITWQIITGPRAGSYIIVSPGHHWKDFDGREEFAAADLADANRSMGSLLDDQVMSYWIERVDLSRNPNWETPAKMISVTRYTIDPASVSTFTDAIKRINAGMDKVKYPAKPSRWFQLANGGEAPAFVLHSDRASMADMEPLDKSLDEAMAEAHGKAQGAALMESLRKSIKSLTTELRVYRADLSYNPAKSTNP